MVKLSWSKLGIIISALIVGYIIFSNKYWRDDQKIVESDVVSYYAYLPSILIYQDATLMYVDKHSQEVKVWFQTTEDGRRTIKTTMGLSYLYAPFFILAHQYAINTAHLPTGYTLPYRFAIVFSSFFYFLLGLYFLRKLLLRYFSEFVTFLTILAVGIGTNVVNYVTREPGMSHAYSFFLIALFLFLVDQWYRKKKNSTLYWIGLVCGVIALVRLTNIIVVLVFVLWNISSWNDFTARIRLLLSKWPQLLLTAFIGFCMLLPQLLYWKYSCGDWVFYSYNDNEHFFFNDPKFISGLFSYRKGWLLYTPIMAFSIIGLLLPSKKLKPFRLSIGLLLILQLYVVLSWWSWWYGGSYGLRPMIDIYTILAFPIAAFLSAAMNLKLWIKAPAIILTLIIISFNLFQAYQYRIGVLHFSAMTKESYWMIWGETELMPGFYESLDEPNNEAAKNGIR